MKYHVTIDFASIIIEVEAKDKEEAEKKAMEEMYENQSYREPSNFWVGECDEVKDDSML